MFLEQALRLISNVLVGIWVARYLGPVNFGVFSYVLAFVAIFGSIAKLGLDAIVVRELVNNPHKKNSYLGTAFWLKLVGALLTITIIFSATQLTNNSQIDNLYILIIASGIIFQAFEVVDFYFQSEVLLKFVSISRIIQLVISSFIKVYLVFTGAGLFWFVLVSLFDQFSLATAYVLAYWSRKQRGFYFYFDTLIAKKLLNDSWPLIFSSLVVMIYMRIDQVMIKEMLGSKEVGVYSAAVRLAEAWYFIPMAITSSLFPAIINAKKTSEALYYTRLQRLFTFTVWVAIAIALPLTFFSDQVVVLLYGKEYIEAGNVLMIQAWAGVFVSLGVTSGSWLTSENFQGIAFYRTLAGAAINIVLNLFAIPNYGIVGAAIATLVSYMFASLLFDMFNSKTRRIFLMKIYTLTFKMD